MNHAWLKLIPLLAIGVFGNACADGEIGPGLAPTEISTGDPRTGMGNAGPPHEFDGGVDDDFELGTGGTDPLQEERPSAYNTGPTDLDALSSSGSITVTTNGAVVENVDVTGTITVEADNVTIRNFRIDAAGKQYGINIGSSHSGIVIEDGEIFGMESAGILGYGVTARRLYVHDSGGDALKIAGGPSLVEYCFIEKVGKSPDAHADGNQTRGGSDITFRYNNIYMPFQGTPNSPGAPYKSNATFMLELGISNFVIENNWLNGGTYTVYCPSPEKGGVYIRNNIFGRDNAGLSEGKDEYHLRTGNCAEWSGNRWEDTGELTVF